MKRPIDISTFRSVKHGRRSFLAALAVSFQVLAFADPIQLWKWDYKPAMEISAAIDSGGNVALARFPANHDHWDIYTSKYSGADGHLLWERHYEDSLSAEGVPAVAFDSDGNVLIAGILRNDNTSRFFLVKYASIDGTLLWERVGESVDMIIGCNLAIDAKNDVSLVVGEAIQSEFGFHAFKFSGATGSEFWEQRFVGQPQSTHGVPSVISIDLEGNVVIAGAVHLPDTEAGFGELVYQYALKLSRDTGSLVWQQHYTRHLQGWGDLHGPALALDPENNIIIGEADDDGSYLAKYSAQDGQIKWEQFPHAGGLISAIASDRSGDIVATGTDQVFGGQSDTYTAKYAATNGNLLWAKSNGDPGGRDVPTGIVVDLRGNIVIAGTTERYLNGPRAANSYYVAGYSSLDGSLNWQEWLDSRDNSSISVLQTRALANGEIRIVGNAIQSSTSTLSIVTCRETLAPVSIIKAGQQIKISFVGEGGARIELLQATSLSGPWETVIVLAAEADGRVEYAFSPDLASRFYRVRQLEH